LLIVGFIVVVALIATLFKSPPNSFNDGVQWAKSSEAGVLLQVFPGCSRDYMVSSSEVADPNYDDDLVVGAGEPDDNYSRWRAGCESTDNRGLVDNGLGNSGNGGG
jgi:hypothetical protein